ncbi:hypothetical protein [Desulfoscipio geothermicus]|uniref:Uncharacterized protein n=1 Tax=Desulfoscipio geothermicus DSM 3669 TaxID=1121426 RepID=A0A1I6EHS7_9FIRM|nr:hypothetical protein [Desulfoscipio geothermicus]SFR17255.1 hypothetical protein SAMN05660706_14512 [Desulfoscipio geothermicus DSM 3669]
MRKDTLYNVVFPLWIVIFFPPFIFLVLFANLIIDGAVIYLTLRLHKVNLEEKQLVLLILKAWGFGFVADLIGVIVMLFFVKYFNTTGYYAFENPVEAVSFIISISLAGLLIGLFNFYQCRKVIDRKAAGRVGLAMGLLTAPWMFLLPSSILN